MAVVDGRPGAEVTAPNGTNRRKKPGFAPGFFPKFSWLSQPADTTRADQARQ